jgi:hypothetical protein
MGLSTIVLDIMYQATTLFSLCTKLLLFCTDLIFLLRNQHGDMTILNQTQFHVVTSFFKL